MNFLSSLISPAGKTILFTSRKGGVGKTVIVGNLGICLHQMGYSVLIIDPSFSGSFSTTFGINTNEHSFGDVIEKKIDLDSLICTNNDGLNVLNASYEVLMTSKYTTYILSIFNRYDFRLIDSLTTVEIPQGLFKGLLAGQIIMVTTPDPSSIQATYAHLKHTTFAAPQQTCSLIVNQSLFEEGESTVRLLNEVLRKYFNVKFDALIFIPVDQQNRKSVKNQVSVITAFPDSRSTRLFKELAEVIVGEA